MSLNLDPQTVAIYFAGLLVVPGLAALFRSSSPTLPQKLWAEFACSVALGYLVLVATGGLPLIPSLPFGDPLLFIAALGEIFSKVLALATVVYLFLGEQLQATAYLVRGKVFRAQLRPGDRPSYPRH